MRSIARKSARPSRMLPRSTKVSPTRRRRWQPRFRPARNILRSRRAATTSRHWSSGCCLSKPPSGPEKSRRRPAFPIACRRPRPLGRSLFRHVAGLGLDRVADAVVRWRAQLHDLDKSVTHSLVAIVAVFDDSAVRRIESLHVFCLYCFVDRGESFVVKILPDLVLGRLGHARGIHRTVHVFRHVCRKRPVATLCREVHVLETIADLAHRYSKLRESGLQFVDLLLSVLCLLRVGPACCSEHQAGRQQCDHIELPHRASPYERWAATTRGVLPGQL